jgi:hypothetical protein
MIAVMDFSRLSRDDLDRLFEHLQASTTSSAPSLAPPGPNALGGPSLPAPTSTSQASLGTLAGSQGQPAPFPLSSSALPYSNSNPAPAPEAQSGGNTYGMH